MKLGAVMFKADVIASRRKDWLLEYVSPASILDLHANATDSSSGSYSVGMRTLRGTRLYFRA